MLVVLVRSGALRLDRLARCEYTLGRSIWVFVCGGLMEQKLESRLTQYRAYLPRNPSCSKMPEASVLRGDAMILLCAA